MTTPFLRRLGFAVLVFAGAGVVVSLALASTPGEASFGDRAAAYLKIFFTFDYAGRRTDNFPLGAVLLHRSALTFTLIGGALGLALALAVPTGVLAGSRPHSRFLRGWTALLSMLSAMPLLVLGILGVLVATRLFGVPPYRSFLDAASGGAVVLVYLLPMATLAVGDGLLADLTRTTRLETTRILDQDYIRALRARGVPAGRHLARGLLVPVLTTVTAKIAYLIGGSVVVEYVFGWPGLGYQVLEALTAEGARDAPFLLAATALFAGIAVALQLIRAAVLLASDPRLRTLPV